VSIEAAHARFDTPLSWRVVGLCAVRNPSNPGQDQVEKRCSSAASHCQAEGSSPEEGCEPLSKTCPARRQVGDAGTEMKTVQTGRRHY